MVSSIGDNSNKFHPIGENPKLTPMESRMDDLFGEALLNLTESSKKSELNRKFKILSNKESKTDNLFDKEVSSYENIDKVATPILHNNQPFAVKQNEHLLKEKQIGVENQGNIFSVKTTLKANHERIKNANNFAFWEYDDQGQNENEANLIHKSDLCTGQKTFYA